MSDSASATIDSRRAEDRAGTDKAEGADRTATSGPEQQPTQQVATQPGGITTTHHQQQVGGSVQNIHIPHQQQQQPLGNRPSALQPLNQVLHWKKGLDGTTLAL